MSNSDSKKHSRYIANLSVRAAGKRTDAYRYLPGDQNGPEPDGTKVEEKVQRAKERRSADQGRTRDLVWEDRLERRTAKAERLLKVATS